MKPDNQENLMRHYLLGGLPESEAAVLEQEFFADDEKFEQMWEAENNLVDGYVRGRLSPEDRERFERHYLASPVHRQRVAVARNLIEKADMSKASAIAPELSWRAKLFEKFHISPARWRFAMAAAMLLLAAGGLWLLVDRAQLRDELARIKAESEARRSSQQSLADQVAAAQAEREELASELERLQAERDALLQQPAQTPRPAIFSFLLSPVLIRSSGDPQTLTIPMRADVVHLQMKVERGDARRFQVNVRTVEGRQAWKQMIGPQTNGARALVTARIPASRLATGDYILTLTAIDSTGSAEEVNRYFFRVPARVSR
jgi:hypothetical protein